MSVGFVRKCLLSITRAESRLVDAAQAVTISSWIGKSCAWNLIHRSSVDGFGAADFHRNCDNQGETLGVIQSTDGWLFGWWTPCAWTSVGDYKSESRTIIFTLTNPAGVPAKFANNGSYSVYDHGSYGPTFGCYNLSDVAHSQTRRQRRNVEQYEWGLASVSANNEQRNVYYDGSYDMPFGGGFDLCIADGANCNTNSYTNFPNTYIDSTGRANATFTGARNFTVKEMEVYALSVRPVSTCRG